MPEPLIVTVAQPPCVSHDVAANAVTHAATVRAAGPGLVARASEVAVEHGTWVAVASFAGDAGGGFTPAAGRSGIWSPQGTAVASAGTEAGAVASVALT